MPVRGNKRTASVLDCKTYKEMMDSGIFDEWLEEVDGNEAWEPERGEIYFCVKDDRICNFENLDDAVDRFNFESGNCFETYKDAEGAIEKSRALRRLRRKGLKFDHYEWNDHNVLEIYAKLPWIDQICPEYDQISDDLYRVFGKEDK